VIGTRVGIWGLGHKALTVLVQQLSLQVGLSAAVGHLAEPNVYLSNIGRGRCHMPSAEHVAGLLQYPCGMTLQSVT